MDDVLFFACISFVGVLNIAGILFVAWLLRRDRGLALSKSGLEAREQIEMETNLMLAEMKAVWDNPGIPKEKRMDAILQVAFKYPRAASRVPKEVIKFVERFADALDRFKKSD